MRRRSYLALVLAVLLFLTPAMSRFAIASENGEMTAALSDEEGIMTTSGGDAGGTGGGSGGNAEGEDQTGKGTEENIQLPVPTGLRWGNNWTAEWDEYTGKFPEGIAYILEIYKDGELFAIKSIGSGDGSWLNEYDRASQFIEDSGTYKFRLQTALWLDGVRTDSEWSEWSEEKTYVRPQQQLSTVVGHWSEEEKGVFLFPALDGVFYFLQMYFTPQGSDEETLILMYTHKYYADSKYSNDVEKFASQDMKGFISSYGAGKYRGTIQLYSEDIDTIANGVEGEFSDYYDTSQTAETVSSLIDDAVSNSKTKKDALEAVKENIEKRSLYIAMQTDDTVLNQIKDLEKEYAAEQGVTVATPSVSAEAGTYVDASEISVIGAGLNAAAGNKVGLEISVPEKMEDVPGIYYPDTVQLDIRLVRDGESVHQLDIPITITMPVPTGINLDRLVLLHYRENGTYEIVSIKNNGDGTITFTVDGFSTFVFAETESEEAGLPEEPDTADTGNTEQNNTPSSSMKSPETGEGMETMQILVIAVFMVVAGLGTFLVWKKKEY